MRNRKWLALFCATLALGVIVGCGGDDDDSGGNNSASTSNSSSSGGGDTIKVGVLSDCEGDFGSFFEPTASGFNQAHDRRGGREARGREAV